jgi:hypothetical protein
MRAGEERFPAAEGETRRLEAIHAGREQFPAAGGESRRRGRQSRRRRTQGGSGEFGTAARASSTRDRYQKAGDRSGMGRLGTVAPGPGDRSRGGSSSARDEQRQENLGADRDERDEPASDDRTRPNETSDDTQATSGTRPGGG